MASGKKLKKPKHLQKIEVPRVNYIKNIAMEKALLTETKLASMKCLPRPEPVSLAGREQLKTPWDFFKSIFKTYKPDTKKILEDSFDIDWAQTKCEKIIRGEGEAEKIKAYLKSLYKPIREVYKYYSGIQPMGRLTCMLPGTCIEMFSNCPDLIDGRVVRNTDVELQVIACNGGMKNNNYLNPDKAITRNQMVELLVRLAVDKYVKPGIAPTYSEAVVMLMEKNVLPYFSTFDCQKFRTDKLWREEIDVLYTRLETALREVYIKFTGKYAVPSQRVHTMSLEEFIDMMTMAELVDENFGIREVGPVFSLSVMTNKGELETDRHLGLTFVEFLEALARCAEKFNLKYLEDQIPKHFPKNPYKLDKKLECISLRLIQKILPRKQSDIFVKQYKDIIDKELNSGKAMKFQRKR